MDEPRFDSWTRRRIGLATGGLTIAALSLLAPTAGQAKKRKKKCKEISCQNLREVCAPDSKQQRCCQGLNCDLIDGQGVGLRCCLGRQQRCQISADCCGTTLCLNANGLTDPRCCGVTGAFCTSDTDCCTGYECAGSACAAISDRALKANFASADAADVLNRVRDLPICTWNYASDHPAIRHIGPMAQDFAAIFGVGADDRHIHPIDGQGVALAAIQGLIAEVEQLRAANDGLAQRLADLETEPRPTHTIVQ